VTCDFSEPDGITLIVDQWWRSTVSALLARLQESVKPGARPYSVALERALSCLHQDEGILEAYRQGRNPFDEHPEPPETEPDTPSIEPWANVQVWDPVFLITSIHKCPRCGEATPVGALLAQRYLDLAENGRHPRRTPPSQAQHVVLLYNIERMSADLECAVARVAPQIRPRRPPAAAGIRYQNHCRACGTCFADNSLGKAEGPFWAWSREELQSKGISVALLPVDGMGSLRCGYVASDIYVWAHELWWIGVVRRLIAKLGIRGDPQSRSYSTALERAMGESAYVESRTRQSWGVV
jgi:hypothetical protein